MFLILHSSLSKPTYFFFFILFLFSFHSLQYFFFFFFTVFFCLFLLLFFCNFLSLAFSFSFNSLLSFHLHFLSFYHIFFLPSFRLSLFSTFIFILSIYLSSFPALFSLKKLSEIIGRLKASPAFNIAVTVFHLRWIIVDLWNICSPQSVNHIFSQRVLSVGIL